MRAVTYRFGPYRLDTAERRLVEGARTVALTPKAFDLLCLLIRERPRAVPKDEILSVVWPDVFVTENNLATVVRDLRAALDDAAAMPRYVRTVFGYGYAFVGGVVEDGAVTAPAVASGWVLLVSGREVPLVDGDNVVGREAPAGIVINAPSVSRRHARLSVEGPRLVCEDLQSKNGTWVGTTRVAAPTELHDGDEVRFGSVLAVVRRPHDSASTETVQVR